MQEAASIPCQGLCWACYKSLCSMLWSQMEERRNVSIHGLLGTSPVCASLRAHPPTLSLLCPKPLLNTTCHQLTQEELFLPSTPLMCCCSLVHNSWVVLDLPRGRPGQHNRSAVPRQPLLEARFLVSSDLPTKEKIQAPGKRRLLHSPVSWFKAR